MAREALWTAVRRNDLGGIHEAIRCVEAPARPALLTQVMSHAAAEGRQAVLALAMELGGDVNGEPDFPASVLCAAIGAAAGSMEMVDTLLAAGADPNGPPSPPRRGAPLCTAARAGRADMVARLLRAGANPNMWANASPLCCACEAKQFSVEAVRLLLEAGAVVNDGGGPALTLLRNQHSTVAGMELLIAHRANLRTPDLLKTAALHSLDMLALMQRAGVGSVVGQGSESSLLAFAATTPKDWRGKAPPDVAAVICALAGMGLNVNERDMRGNTALHRAIHANMLAAIPPLIECGANVSARNLRGDTPLHYATVLCPPAVAALVLAGADVTVSNRDGGTPADMCADGDWERWLPQMKKIP